MPKVSIVLPCYNGAALLGEAINSCLNQTFKDWELIIINDCSTDNTLEVATSYAEKDKRIKVFTNEKNSKLPASLNNGFRRAVGEYWTWTSDDNLLHPTMLEEMVNYLDEHDEVGFVVADYNIIDLSGNVVSVVNIPNDIQICLQLNNYVGASFMYRKKYAIQVGDYNEDLFLVEDYDYWIRLNNVCKLNRLPKCLYSYRKHEGSLSETRKEDIRLRLLDLRIKYLEQTEKQLKNYPSKLSLYYYRIVDNLTGKERIKYFFRFFKKLPLSFGLKYLLIHIPHRLIK